MQMCACVRARARARVYVCVCVCVCVCVRACVRARARKRLYLCLYVCVWSVRARVCENEFARVLAWASSALVFISVSLETHSYFIRSSLSNSR